MFQGVGMYICGPVEDFPIDRRMLLGRMRNV